ncbi:MAG: glycerophosphodiester phosphodiesterase family protein [Planctomycetota bacterium]
MTLVIAHRGASVEAPENTVPAIRRAWKREADGVEIDIHLTRDNRLAVIHDGDTGRVAKVALPVATSTLAQLQSIDVGRWKKKRYVGRRVPSLDQALAFVDREKWAFLELKSGPRIAPFFVRELARLGRFDSRLMICSFKLETLAAVRDEIVRQGIDFPVENQKLPTNAPRATAQRWGRGGLGWICGLAEVEALRHNSERETMFWRAESAGCSWLSLHHSRAIEPSFVSDASKHGFRIACWTVDKEQEATRLARVGVHAVITNDPKKTGPYVKAVRKPDEQAEIQVSNQAKTKSQHTRAALPAWASGE